VSLDKDRFSKEILNKVSTLLDSFKFLLEIGNIQGDIYDIDFQAKSSYKQQSYFLIVRWKYSDPLVIQISSFLSQSFLLVKSFNVF